MARALANWVAEPDLAPSLDDLAAHLAYLYVETAVEARWSRYADGADLTGAQRGRAFGPRCEVQFQRRGDGYALLLLTDLPRPGGGESLDLGQFDQEEGTYALWGVRADGADAWTEPGSPRRWTYPLEPAPRRVGVRAIEYRDHETGALQFRRYVDLVPFEEGR